LFIEYTEARSPLDYCNKIKSPPPYLLLFDKNGNSKAYLNSKYEQTFVDPLPVNQENSINLVDETASSSGVDNFKKFNND